MQPIPTHLSASHMTNVQKKINTQSTPIIFRPYNHYPMESTFNTFNTTEPHLSAFKKVVSKRPNTAEISSGIPLKLCRTKCRVDGSLTFSKLIPSTDVNSIKDGQLLSIVPKSYDTMARNDESNGIHPLNLKKNTKKRETIPVSSFEHYEQAYDLSISHQRQPKLNDPYQSNIDLYKQQIQHQHTAKGNFILNRLFEEKKNIHKRIQY